MTNQVDRTAYVGPMDDTSSASEFNALSFVIAQLVGRNATTSLVQIMAVTNAGGITPVGTVDVLPLVNQIDGAGNGTPHGTVFGLPYFRLQGGANAVILDPQVGDIGIAVFCSHDISVVKATKKQGNPGSRRRFSMSDGVYIGGCMNGAPVQYVGFSDAGITVVSPKKVTITAPNIEADASTQFTVNTPAVVINGTNTITLNGPQITMNANTAVTLNAPQIALNGAVTQSGGTSGGNVTMQGPVNIINPLSVQSTATIAGDLTAAGTSVHTHTHTDPQGGNTGPPT